MKVVFVSTYELGHQPLHLAAPAASALARGHQVRCLDLSVVALGPLAMEDLEWADAVAISVPMHTAMRLAVPLCRMLRSRWPDKSICLYGLYSPLAAEEGLAQLADQIIAGEYSDRLVSWLNALASPSPAPKHRQHQGVHIELRRGSTPSCPHVICSRHYRRTPSWSTEARNAWPATWSRPTGARIAVGTARFRSSMTVASDWYRLTASWLT